MVSRSLDEPVLNLTSPSTRYVDLLHMVQPDYANDPIILLLLKEMEEYANVSDAGSSPHSTEFSSL